MKYPIQYFGKGEIQHSFPNILIRKYIDWRIKNYGKAIYSINREVMVIKILAKYAVETIPQLEMYPLPNIKQRQYPEERRKRILFPEELDKLLQHLKDTNNLYFYNVVMFLANSGVRIKEMIQLKYKDINEKTITIFGNKTNTIRSIPYTQILKDVTMYMSSRFEKVLPDDYVFVNDNNHHQQNYWQCFSKALKRIGITERIPIYTLRHYYTTMMLKNEVCSIPTLAAVLSNSPITLQKHYSHLDSHSAANTILKNMVG